MFSIHEKGENKQTKTNKQTKKSNFLHTELGSGGGEQPYTSRKKATPSRQCAKSSCFPWTICKPSSAC